MQGASEEYKKLLYPKSLALALSWGSQVYLRASPHEGPSHHSILTKTEHRIIASCVFIIIHLCVHSCTFVIIYVRDTIALPYCSQCRTSAHNYHTPSARHVHVKLVPQRLRRKLHQQQSPPSARDAVAKSV